MTFLDTHKTHGIRGIKYDFKVQASSTLFVLQERISKEFECPEKKCTNILIKYDFDYDNKICPDGD